MAKTQPDTGKEVVETVKKPELFQAYRIVSENQRLHLLKVGSTDLTTHGIAREMPEAIWHYLVKPTNSTLRITHASRGHILKSIKDLPDFGTGYLYFETGKLPQLSGFNPSQVLKEYKICTLHFDPAKHDSGTNEEKLLEFKKGVEWLNKFLNTSPYKENAGDCKIYGIGENHVIKEI